MSCSRARPAAARPRSTSAPAQPRSSAAAARSCSCRRSRSRRRRSAASGTRFGDRVAVLHSGLSEAERRDERERIARGEAPIVVGARSAVFAPVRSLGVVCVDEEHDPVVQAGVRPALRRADRRRQAGRARKRRRRLRERHAASRELGAARAARARRHGSGAELPARSRRRPAPRDRLPAVGAARSTELARVAERRGRAILLLNRRGVIPAVHCRSCGATRRCPDCDVALVLHRDGVLHCHHCGHSRGRRPSTAPPAARPSSCASAPARSGSSVSSSVRFPGLEPIRLDSDTASNPAVLAAALERFRSTPGSVLLGTQMVAKGHHFAGVELAAVVDADLGLSLPRLPGRGADVPARHAARRPAAAARRPGRVIVQTFQPDAPGDPLRRSPRRGRVSRGGARAAARARLSAVRASRARARLRADLGVARCARSTELRVAAAERRCSGLPSCRGSAAATARS